MSVLPSKCRKYLLEHGILFEEVDGPQKAITLRGYPLPSGQFDSDRADVLILLPDGYPDVRPDMFYAMPWLKMLKDGGYPKAADQAFAFANQNWQRWSRHQDQWRPGQDGIWTTIHRINAALATAA